MAEDKVETYRSCVRSALEEVCKTCNQAEKEGVMIVWQTGPSPNGLAITRLDIFKKV